MKKSKFLLFYILLMIPTYILPYFGSNSTVAYGSVGMLGAAGASTGDVGATAVASSSLFGLLFLSALHLISMILMVVITKKRQAVLDANYVLAFPIIAIVFDFVPGLSAIPLVPTVMHVLAIVMGVVKEKQNIETSAV